MSGDGDDLLYLGLIPNFHATINRIDLGDFLIENLGWEEINNCFPDAFEDFKIAAKLGNKPAQDYLRSKGISW